MLNDTATDDKSFRVTRVLRLENVVLWRMYALRRELIRRVSTDLTDRKRIKDHDERVRACEKRIAGATSGVELWTRCFVMSFEEILLFSVWFIHMSSSSGYEKQLAAHSKKYKTGKAGNANVFQLQEKIAFERRVRGSELGSVILCDARRADY